jgi:hypothetical protein
MLKIVELKHFVLYAATNCCYVASVDFMRHLVITTPTQIPAANKGRCRMDKKRWSDLKHKFIEPANDEERNALNQWKEDKNLEKQYWFNQISEPIRKYRGTQPQITTLRGFGKSER